MDRFMAWFQTEPAVTLMMVIAALVLFASAVARNRLDSAGFWPWVRRLVEASVGALLFLGLLWAFRMVLNSNVDSFASTHGSRSEANQQSAYTIWGRPHIQEELSVYHTVEVQVQEELPREDPTQPPLYRTVTQIQAVPQNSIRSFHGTASMQLSEREKGYAFYSGFVLQAEYRYVILNDSDLATDAFFNFPLSSGQTLFQDFLVEENGRDIGSEVQYGQDMVSWTRKMRPHQQIELRIGYASRGMDFFYYHVPFQREIRDFDFTLTIDRLPTDLLNYPQGVLTPTEIRKTADGKGSILNWKLDRAITVAGMGVALPQPAQPGEQVLRVLVNSPYALTMLGALIALTLLILGLQVNFLDLALLAGAYCVQFLVMAGVSDYGFGFWGGLAAGAAATICLAFLLFRKLPSRGLLVLMLCLVAFYAVAYPLSGLLDDPALRNAFDSLVQVGMILYLFVLSLVSRLRPAKPAGA